MDRSKSGCHHVCITLINRKSLHYVMIAGRPTHHQPALPGKLRNGQSPHDQYEISVICSPGNGNKTLEQNDSCIVMSFNFILAKAAVFAITYSLRIKLYLKQFQKIKT